ncbi:MAG: magnesium/cobalt transporter CorA, partial [Planctomycetes bacterium]|nr:magnesium/cobalt transporter CorA [Planctomycetota bacterium]
PGAVLWVDLDAPTDEERCLLDDPFAFHPLTIEDCRLVNNRPKIELHERYLFAVIHAADPSVKDSMATVELEAFLGANFLVTHHIKPVPSVTRTRELCRNASPRLVEPSADSLFYAILDGLVNDYAEVFDRLDERIEKAQEQALARPTRNVLRSLSSLRKDLRYLRRILGYQWNAIHSVVREQSPHVSRRLRAYYHDIYDRLLHMHDMVEEYREILQGAMDLHFMAAQSRINEVLKVLTTVATVLTPPMLIASIYGMNFQHIPELRWPWGYLFAWGLMAASSAAMFFYCKHKRWI